MLFGDHLRPFSSFKETVDLYLCFDAHFRKFRDFWWFLVIFNRKMNILDPFFEDLWQPPLQKSRYICLYLHGPLKTC